METRRGFLREIGAGLLTASVAAPSILSSANASPGSETKTGSGKAVRIGIIGAENSHSRGYGNMFNVKKQFPGVEVAGIWGETDEFAKYSAENAGIPWIVKDPREFMGKIDALIVDHRHAKFHLDAARPFVEAGITTFIDKPFCYRTEPGREFLALARAKGVPVSSFSTVARGPHIADLKAQVAETGMENIYQIISTGHCDIDSIYGGVFFYGVHQVQQMMEVFGEDIEQVRVTRSENDATATLVYSSGVPVTMLLSRGRPRFDLAIVTKAGVVKLVPRVEPDSMYPYGEMVEMFQEGTEPRTHDSLIRETAILEALERSVDSDGWERVQA
ncbi:Gfo/Idh/MocA family protein [candidate division KSB1 bacterium]